MLRNSAVVLSIPRHSIYDTSFPSPFFQSTNEERRFIFISAVYYCFRGVVNKFIRERGFSAYFINMGSARKTCQLKESSHVTSGYGRYCGIVSPSVEHSCPPYVLYENMRKYLFFMHAEGHLAREPPLSYFSISMDRFFRPVFSILSYI